MLRSPRSWLLRLGLGVVLIVPFAALVSPAPGYQPFKDAPEPANPPPPVVIQLPIDKAAQTKLHTAQEYIAEKRWNEAIKLLQSVVDQREDSFIHIDADPVTKTGERTCSSREEATRRIGALPAAGLEAYQIAYHEPAQRVLDQAKERHEAQLLQDVVRRYRYTRPGAEALELLGAYALDRGEFDLAAVCYQRLLERTSRGGPSKDLLFKAVLAFRFTGNTELEQQTTRQLAFEIGGGTFKIGKQTYTAEQVRAEIARLPAARATSGDTLVFRHDRGRVGATAGDFPYLQPAFHVATTEPDPSGEEAWSLKLLKASMKANPANAALLPAAVPIAVGERVVYRSAFGLHALDAKSGKELWRTPSPLGLDTMAHTDAGKKVQIDDWFQRQYPNMKNVLFDNSVLGTLSSDGTKVYAIEDLPLPPHPNQIMMDQQGQKRYFGPLKDFINHNHLRALDLTTGKVVWEVPSKKAPSRDLEDAFFLGVPLPIGGNLFVLTERFDDLRLLCLRADSGTVLWSQTLGSPREKMLLDVGRRTQAIHLSYEDGVLVCPTNSGLVLGVDPMSRTLLWAHIYRDPPSAADPNNPGAIYGYNVDTLTNAWKGAAPLIANGRIIFTAVDSDALRCLDLHTGALLWKIMRTEEDLYVGTVHDGKVLVVGKNGCRLYSLTTGSQLWQQQTERPSGIGVACGKYYYLPLDKGGLLALNLDNPRESAQIAPHSDHKPGNLVLHGGLLWSQDVLSLTAFPEMTAYLSRVEARLKIDAHDVAALAERAELRLDRGDVAAAAADLHAVLANKPSQEQAQKAREKLFTTLTQLLGRDFTGGEKYLAEYLDLCKVPVPADAPEAERTRLEAEGQKRLTQYHILVAHGRASQGKLGEAVKAYRALHERTRSEELLAIPFDPTVQVRPERWVQTQVGVLVSQASDKERAALQVELEREWHALAGGNDLAAVERFGTLFGAIPGPLGAPGRAALFRLAERRVTDANRRFALDAELALHRLQLQADTPAFAAQALYTRARLLARHGLLEDATDCYRELNADYPNEVIAEGRTGAQLFADLENDKRFLPYLHEPRSNLVGTKVKATESTGNFNLTKAVVSHEPHYNYNLYGNPFGNATAMIDKRTAPPAPYRHLRFLLDVPNGQLQVVDRDTGAERWSVPMPVSGARQYINDGTDMVCYRAVDHLAVFSIGQFIVAVDLIERRVRWTLNLLEGQTVNARFGFQPGPDGTIYVYSNDGSGMTGRYGLLGPVTRSGCYVQTANGLAAIDLATGQTRWLRRDVPTYFDMHGDDEYAYLVERQMVGEGAVRGVRAFRVSDGVAVDVPEAVDAFAHRQRSIGRHLLVADMGPREELIVRFYDVQTGKDFWKKTYPAGSLLLDGNAPDVVAVASMQGHADLLDPLTGNELQRLKFEPKFMAKAVSGVLLRDKTQWYVGFQLPKGPNANVDDGPNPDTSGEIVSLPINGRLFAYDRKTGDLRWASELKYQMLIVERFEELPFVLCSAMTVRGGGNPAMGGNVPVNATIVVDKTTGKKRYHKEVVTNGGDTYHTLQVNPRVGTIDFIGITSKVRFTLEK